MLFALALCGADNSLTPREQADGWVLLFDGKTLQGWDSAMPPAPPAKAASPKAASTTPPGGAPAQGSHPRPCSTPMRKSAAGNGASHWEVVDGTLSPCGDIAGYLTSTRSFKNLLLSVDFQTGEDTNSGIFLRSPDGNLGYEVQIWKAQPAGYNTGSIVGAGRTARPFDFIPDQWNHYEIMADGDHLLVVLNGVTTLDVRDRQFSEGRVRLQYQKFPIAFKNIKLKEIRH